MKRQIQLALKTTRDFAAAVGVAALAGFYAAERSILWLAIATLLLAGTWYLIWRIRRAVAVRAERNGPRRKYAQGLPAPDLGKPILVRRFVCFDPDTGDEVFKSEAVN